MSELLCADNLYLEQRGRRMFCARKDITVNMILEVLAMPGESLKRSRKAAVRRVGRTVIKESTDPWPLGLLKYTMQRSRHRRGWIAGHYLRQRGVNVPEPFAYVECGWGRLVWGNAFLYEYLDGFRNVEKFMQALVQRGAGKDTIAGFLERLADAVNGLTGAGAYHADLSGKNIFTRDGTQFYFIDLDAVVLGGVYDDTRRLYNHVQLYDSFCDVLNDAMLVPFITRMLTPEHDPRVWMPAVRKGQHQRRRRVEARWAREGKRKA